MPEERIVINGEEFVRISRFGVLEDHPEGGGPGGADAYYEHVQDTPSATWIYEHGLGKYPAVTTIGTDGGIIEGNVTYLDLDTVMVEHSVAISGKALNS